MRLQALVNLRLKSADSVMEVRAGETVDLPQDKVDTLLKKIPDRIRVIPDTPLTEPSPEARAFNFNANLPPNETASTPQEFIPAGTRVAYRSPLFGELEAEVLDDRGACLWVWHPLRQCEACIPRGWVVAGVCPVGL